jgi:hypothetical protein
MRCKRSVLMTYDYLLQFFYISELFYLTAITLTKLSLLLFFGRIFPNKKLRIGAWITFGFVIMINLSFIMAICFQCVSSRLASRHLAETNRA